jgi:FkbM family methyltransferase
MAHYTEIVLEPGASPLACLNRIEAKYLYDNDIPNYFRHGVTLRPGDTILDIGANIGLFAAQASRLCESDARIFCFEPIPATFDILRHNAAAIGGEKMRVFSFGVASEARRLRFANFPRLACWSSAYVDQSNLGLTRARLKQCLSGDVDAGLLFRWLRPAPQPLRSLVLDVVAWWLTKIEYFDCEVRTISQILREQGVEHVDLLKVDVEGAELDVLLGVEDADWPKIKQIVVEVEEFQERSKRIVDLLAEHGFETIATEQLGDAQKANDMGMLWARASDA